MIRVAALTSSQNDPSSRLRMRQYFGPLRALGVDAVEYRPWISKYTSRIFQMTGLGLISRVYALIAAQRYDVVWLNRELVRGRETLERYAGRHAIFDVDDAIWLTGQSPFAESIARHCAGVIAANETIAAFFRPHARRLWIVPTCVDTRQFIPRPAAARDGFTVGWSGTHWNLRFLQGIEEPLADFLNDHPGSRLLVASERQPQFRILRPHQWSFVRWSPATDVSLMQEMDVGIMPLRDNEWTRAKCPTKMICYMAVGLPVVASPVGGVATGLLQKAGFAAVCPSDWYTCLHNLRESSALRASVGHAGRKSVEESYSMERYVPRLAEIFSEVARS